MPTNTTAAPTVAPTGGCPNRWMKFGTKVRLLNLYFREVFKMTTLQQRPTIKFYIEPLFGFKCQVDSLKCNTSLNKTQMKENQGSRKKFVKCGVALKKVSKFWPLHLCTSFSTNYKWDHLKYTGFSGEMFHLTLIIIIITFLFCSVTTSLTKGRSPGNMHGQNALRWGAI